MDGAPRVACVTPVRRIAGREVTTLEGLDPTTRGDWAAALLATGGSQCGFCTPGIVMRLAARRGSRRGDGDEQVAHGLAAHLCRCTGWQTIVEAARLVDSDRPGPVESKPDGERDLHAASTRAALEGGAAQRVAASSVLGEAGFADDLCPPDALVAVPDGQGSYVVAESLAEARRRAGKVQGRNIPGALHRPVSRPAGEWDVTLETSWVEPAYLETDASWCAPGGEPADPCANGGAFGGKRSSPVGEVARRLADELGRPVRVLWSREDVVRMGLKRPPVGAGIDRDGRGVLRVGVTDGDRADPAAWDETRWRVTEVAPGLVLETAEVAGPPVSVAVRGAVWVEAAVLATVARRLGSQPDLGVGTSEPIEVTTPDGGWAAVRCSPDLETVDVEVDAGAPLDAVVLRSYCIGAVHQALGWVLSEGIAVDEAGQARDLTVRSFGILPARSMPEVGVRIRASDRPPVNGSDAVFAATAAACWIGRGLPAAWPIDRTRRGGAR